MHNCHLILLGVAFSNVCTVFAADQGNYQLPSAAQVVLSAEFTKNPRCPVFEPDENVSIRVTVAGHRAVDDSLDWRLVDWQNHVIARDSIPVHAGNVPWQGDLTMPGGSACGYFEIHLILKKARSTIPAAGTRPEGFVSYGILPKIKKLELAHVDDSRFGGQGTNFVKSGEVMKGDYIDPVYPLVGMTWANYGHRLLEWVPNKLDDFQPCHDPVEMKRRGTYSYERAAGLCVLTQLHGLPNWLMAIPKGIVFSNYDPQTTSQTYPPNDYAKYEELIGRIAANQALDRKVNFPTQRRNYYFIHWEPDWHWKGSDEDFIRMYEHAFRAIHKKDPDGMLLGPNYGVLAVGNQHLERLLPKGLAKYLDGIVFHGYYLPEEQPPEDGNLVQEIRKMVALARKYLKPDAPLINTEGSVLDSAPMEQYHRFLNRDAAWFMREHLISLGEGAHATWYFYTADIGPKEWRGLFFNLTFPNPVCGATHLSPKPTMLAAALAARLLDGTKNIGVLDRLGRNVWGYAFDRNGTTVAALWTIDGRNREISIPAEGDQATYFDPMGNASRIDCSNGLAKIKIGPVPSYMMGISQKAASTPSLKGRMPSASKKRAKTGTGHPTQNTSFFRKISGGKTIMTL